jgi:transcriptional regulator with XRE-family HTH domain
MSAVVNLDPDICRRLREARKSARLSQSALAAEIGCKQSALSMFEQGDGTKLNDDAIEKFAAKFGIKIKEKTEAVVSASVPPRPIGRERGYCPNPRCPSNSLYRVEERTFSKPDRSLADPVGGTFCALCGEVLEKRCPNCGAPLHEGAVCSHCGEAYIAVIGD